jgi:antitoxin CptB
VTLPPYSVVKRPSSQENVTQMSDLKPISDEDERRRKQIIYRANHRGIKEMDIILGGYASAFAMEMSADEIDAFVRLMDESDRDLYSWFTGDAALPEQFDAKLLQVILDHAQISFKN